ncbi:tuberin isoform X3 [Hydra vulgaris]|uniref:tuberin isoform X3 n=1 Tax=Hydra vulgaris TaxID=6087 RepID=UPI001F5ED7C0|nr:tuberin isoform X4 [Hydra vulgaris]
MKGRFKSLFVRKSSNSTSASDDKNSKEFFFSNEILEDYLKKQDINKRNSIAHRCRTLKELGEIVLTKEIEEHAIEAIWKEIEDLFQPSVNIEGRQTALEFMISLVRGQYKNLGLLRVQFFRLIENHDVNEDLCSRVTLLNCLTENGKDISYYEQIGTFLLQFMSKALLSEKTNDFLLLLVNVIRFNSSFLDKETICSLVKKTCEFCHVANTELEVESCLSLLDVAVKYGGLPPEGLCPLIVTLCRTVNIKNFSQPSWKLMRSLIGTTFGHTVLNLMCCILEDNNNVTDLTLLRGAVFFIGMSIWGSQRVTSLRYQPLHVLPAFKISLQCANFVVAHEVGVSLLRLVNKFGPSQDLITWDIIMDILEILLKVIESLNGGDSQLLSGNVQSILSAIENLYTKNMMRGSVSRFFSIVESCSEDRPESSIITLLTYYEEQITPTRDDWFELFRRVLDNYLKKEKRTSIRVRVIEMITFVFSHHKHKYEDELIELFLKNYISAVVLEKDNEVRLVISQLLANLLQICSSVQYSALLQVVDELLSSLSNQRENLQDIEIIVDALIKTYKNKLFCPQSMFVVNIFTLLVKHVSRYYLINLPPLIGGNIRCKIFAAILSMRANSNHFVGVADGDTIAKYSAHTIFKSVNKEVAGCGEIWTICCDFQIAFDAILTCLKNELDWSVLEFVLKNLPHQLKNKSLFIYCQCNMNKLCAALSNLINDKMYLNKVQNCPATFGISELRNLIFPILSIVATYHSYLSKEQQFELLKCLEFGLNTVCAKTCVSCLTICTLEMQSVMIRVLPSILVKLSQISATVPMAVPVLQFLSSYQHSIRQRSSHSRSYSTGSIEIVKSKGSSFTDDVAWSLNQEDNLQELTERFAKAPLTKSMSNPKNVEQGLTAEETKTFYSRYRAFSAVEPVTNDNMNNVQCEERGPNNGISPYFIFLQLFYSTLSCFSDKIPLLLDHSEVIDRAVHILDRIPTFNTHKFGVLFVDRGQEKSEVEILSNEFGSTRYTDFISGLGELVQLHECISNGIFTGGMDCSGADGKLAYTWKDDTTQVIFHVATLMPNKERDSQCYSKKLHIGNNFVTIIYDESKFGYTFGTIKGQMSLAEILIRPLDYNSNVVTIRIKDNCDAGVMHNHPFIISDQNLPVLVRQLAINTNMAIVTELSEKTTTNAFASNWLERLLQINRIKSKATPQKPSSNYEDARDFVNYT